MSAMNVTVRAADPKDAEAAIQVLHRSINELCTLDHKGDDATIAKWLANKTPQDFLAWLESADNYCVVAERDHHIVGVGMAHRSGEIRLCYLAPGVQRQGVGKAICAALERKAREWGLANLRLQSTAAARPFYESIGFSKCGATPIPGFGISSCYPYEKALIS